MADNKPLVSIGMPTYNGARFIRQSLDALLGQDYGYFELIISDNASTDGTREICQQYAARDKRIHYYRNEMNLGAVKNFNRVLELSCGKYFMWAGDHDLWHPSFISRCVSILDEEPDVVLVYPRTMLIDFEGTPLELMPDQVDTRGMSTLNRYKHLLWNLTYCNMVYGLIRRETLVLSGGFRNILWGPDNALLAELSLKGSFAQIGEPLFYRRKNRPDEAPAAYKERMLVSLDPKRGLAKSKESIENLVRELRNAHLQILLHAPLGCLEKLRAAIVTVQWFNGIIEHRSALSELSRK